MWVFYLATSPAYGLQRFSPSLQVVFSFSLQCLSKAEVFMFGEFQFPNIFMDHVLGIISKKSVTTSSVLTLLIGNNFKHPEMLQKTV